ncbi:MAG: DUF2892 domain-containing protein [Weeksellaceae bacterium]|nr:DUF2892 domain-containing protein [Weeksellaceae bacterium]
MKKYVKLAIAAALLALSIYLFVVGQIGWGVVTMLLLPLPIFLYFRNEYILLTMWEMRKQNMEGAAKWLSKITDPEGQLVRKQMGYYHFMTGAMQVQHNIAGSEKHMRKALEYGLSFAHDRAMAKLNLAAGAMSRGKKQEAQKWLAESKAEDKQNMLTEHIKTLEQQLKKMNVGRNAQNPHMRQRGRYF